MAYDSLIKRLLPFIVLMLVMPALVYSQPNYLPLGSIANLTETKCSARGGAVPGATCYTGTVICPQTDNNTFYFAVKQVPNANGLVALQGPFPDTVFWGSASSAPFAIQDNADGYSTAQIAWSSKFNWLLASPSGRYPENTMIASCREATVLKFISDTYDSNRAIPIGIQAHSAGTGPVLYAIIDYNLGDIVKAAMLSQPTPVGDFLAGCTNPPGSTAVIGTNTAATSDVNPCKNRSSSTVIPASGWANAWLGTHTCSKPPYASQDLTIWETASLDNLNFGNRDVNTKFSMFWCPDANSVPGIGNYFVIQLPKNDVTYDACGPPNDGGSYCPGKTNNEAYWTGNGISPGPGFQEMYQQFEADMRS